MLVSSIVLFAAVASSFAAPSKGKSKPKGWPYSDKDDGKAFGISRKMIKTESSYLAIVDDAPALVASYPEGSYAGVDKGKGGFAFLSKGGKSAKLDKALEATLSYEVMFDDDFDFVKGGKLPGLYGGESDKVAAQKCDDGKHDDKCWSARLMWRKKGKGELYSYLPSANHKNVACKSKDADCKGKFGASLGRGNFTFTPGKWTQVTQRVKLNKVGKKDGEVEIKIGGKTKVHVKGLSLRKSSKGRIRGAMLHTFFGGSTSDKYASTDDQEAYFRNFVIKTTKKL